MFEMNTSFIFFSLSLIHSSLGADETSNLEMLMGTDKKQKAQKQINLRGSGKMLPTKRSLGSDLLTIVNVTEDQKVSVATYFDVSGVNVSIPASWLSSHLVGCDQWRTRTFAPAWPSLGHTPKRRWGAMWWAEVLHLSLSVVFPFLISRIVLTKNISAVARTQSICTSMEVT